MGNDPRIKEAEEDFEKNSEKYAGEYGENLFLKIVKKLPEATTRPFVTLYYILNHPDISTGQKALCVAALGYIVLSLDLIPVQSPSWAGLMILRS
ncbi:hypothetical protein P0082_11250 [Candidatus Haliotispira prima]|uniref:DUF1232 domain-containing protein n=1 Tax=Candidatus Haliotispira prima TaxID=3034016 RepID=A0ABY8MGA6_9SPIO|nr:hypothetical protein P0082_11250 [Candidatus Haliotispira prima]